MENSQNKSTEKFKIIGNWVDQSKQLKDKYAQLTDSDLEFEEGKEEELLRKMETRLNKNREEVINILRKVQPQRS